MSDDNRTEPELDPAAKEDLDRADYERLRRLLLGPEQDKIRRILERLDDPGQHAQEVGDVLPAAVSHSSQKGPALERALAPTMERATRHAITSDTKAFADALFPVMGPAIRKAIAETLRGLIQALNQALEYSLSLRGLKWRWEAFRTGRSFGEVLLSHTLVYRVEQIFLIHRETGLMLQHVVAPEVQAQDADMVSGMLTAIQDFVRDSFQIDQEESLQTMEVGDLQVWVEQGPRAVLAAAVRGTAPVELRQALREALEAIHSEQVGELAAFDGDAAPFERSRYRLEDCLRSQQVEVSRRVSPLLWVLGAVAVVLVTWWLVVGWSFHSRLNGVVTALRAEPGIAITDVERHHRHAVIRGLRDPLSRTPAAVLEEHALDAGGVRLRLQPYQALHDPFILARARQALLPPAGVELSLADGTLIAAGACGVRWRSRARELAPLVAGVTSYDDSALAVLDQDAESWSRLESLRAQVERHAVLFEIGSAEIAAEQAEKLAPVVDGISGMIGLAESLFQVVRVRVAGYADPSGPPEVNVRLSRERAEAVVRLLTEHGIPERLVQPVGRGTLAPVGTDTAGAAGDGDEGLEHLRRVSFEVELSSDRREGDNP